MDNRAFAWGLVLLAALLSGAFPQALGATTANDSLWNDASTAPATADANDSKSIEVGVEFKSDTPGAVIGLNIYLGPDNTGPHTVSLWSAGGTQLASSTTTTTATGWQTVYFAAPVEITSEQIYVASYHAPKGQYAFTQNYFTAAYVSSDGVLSAPIGAGVYLYSAASSFPTKSYLNTNYWVDVVFTPSLVVNGTCGTANGASVTSAPTTNLCATGTASAVSGSGPFAWTCMGSNGGSTASCDASLASTATYVQPGTQGFQGIVNSLPVYSAANGLIPPGTTDCQWESYGLRCGDANLTITNAYIQGGLYWTGCGDPTTAADAVGGLRISNSILDWGTSGSNGWTASPAWNHIYASCAVWNGVSTIAISNSTIRTGPPAGGSAPNQTYPTYTGGSDAGPIAQHTGNFPLAINNDLIAGFPQGVYNFGSGTVIRNSEFYAQDALCVNGSGPGVPGPCHVDVVFNDGASNVLIAGNYLLNESTANGTAVYFSQTSPNVTGNQIAGNFMKGLGAAYTVYNEADTGLNVIDNTFGGALYSDCLLYTVAVSWGAFSGNINTTGVAIIPNANGSCN